VSVIISLKFRRVIRDVENERTHVSGEELVLLLLLVELKTVIIKMALIVFSLPCNSIWRQKCKERLYLYITILAELEYVQQKAAFLSNG
jgi:hypothetical protein